MFVDLSPSIISSIFLEENYQWTFLSGGENIEITNGYRKGDEKLYNKYEKF